MTRMVRWIKARAYKKLKSENGASIILALVGFLIVCFVAVAITNASILNARRTVEEKKEEVAYLATTQAAGLILDCIESDATYKKVEGETESKISGVEGNLKESIQSMADAVSGGSGNTEKDISFSYSGLDKINGTLQGKIKMDPSYTISIDIWVEAGKTDYPLTVIIPGEGTEIDEEIPGTREADGRMETRKVTYASWSGDGAYVISKTSE